MTYAKTSKYLEVRRTQRNKQKPEQLRKLYLKIIARGTDAAKIADFSCHDQ